MEQSIQIYIAMSIVFIVLSIFYFIGVYIRNYKETSSSRISFIVFLNSLYGLFETMIINWVIFELLLGNTGATSELDTGKQLVVAIAICLKNGYAYKETLASLASPGNREEKATI